MSAQRDLEDWQTRFNDLAPLVKEGEVRVIGRLKHAPLTYEEIYPILLPASHPISRLIMGDVHIQVSHGGPERTLSESRRKFWITRGRNLAKGVVKNCTICRKLRQPPHTTLMADLPPERLKPFSPPFSVTGVDLFGPFNLKTGRNRTKKAWGRCLLALLSVPFTWKLWKICQLNRSCMPCGVLPQPTMVGHTR